jgi:hypothetical protein
MRGIKMIGNDNTVGTAKYARSLDERVRLNRAILQNTYWVLPVENGGHANYSPVGRGVKTSDWCGKWVSYMVCKDTKAHEGVFIGSTDVTGKVVVRHQHMWCHKSSCPVCFIRGWSVRQARRIEARFVEADKRDFGKVEHIAVSIPVEDYDLSEEDLRKKARAALLVRGVVGGCLIFHGYRKDKGRQVLVWRPHYHVLGYIKGGFSICRDCVHERGDCASCTGFKGREVREYAKDRYLVKVLGERETVFGTAWYQLNHSTIRYGIKRFQVVTWFGVVSYSKLKTPKVKAEVLCPACHSEMVRSAHVGKGVIVKDLGDVGYVPLFFDDEFDASGEPNYVDFGGGKFG